MEVQDRACRALANLVENSENKAVLVAAGAHKSVVRAMEAHQDSVDVQEQACSALNNLAANVENQVVLDAAGGHTSVVRVMEAHQDYFFKRGFAGAGMPRFR